MYSGCTVLSNKIIEYIFVTYPILLCLTCYLNHTNVFHWALFHQDAGARTNKKIVFADSDEDKSDNEETIFTEKPTEGEVVGSQRMVRTFEQQHVKTNKITCAQRRLRLACTSTQSDQSVHSVGS